MQARWSKTQPAFVAPLLAGLLACGALAFGVFVAAGDTCAPPAAGTPGNYSRSTLAPITAAGSSAAPRGSGK